MKEILTKTRNLKKKVKKFSESRKHLSNLDEFGRQKSTSLNQRYNYSTGSWVPKSNSTSKFQYNFSTPIKHLPNLNELRRQKPSSLKQLYNYSTTSQVFGK